MTIWSLDTESYYDNELSIKTLGAWHYVFHPAADHYLVSVAGSDGTRYVGPPEGAPWSKMAGGIWLSWNTAYDGLVWQRLVRDSRIPKDMPIAWHDPADMAAYLGYPRTLKFAIQAMYGVKVSKDTRDKMKGQRWHNMPPEFRKQVEDYALADAEWPLKVWQDHSHKWPEKERTLSRLTREMGGRGVRIDTDLADRYIKQLKLMCWAAEQKIPFRPSLSLPKLQAACRDAGIESPISLAKDSEESEAWEEKYSGRFPWVGAMRILRRCNALCKKLETIRSRVREDGTCPTELKYFGAGLTGRWSGSGGINWQNFPRLPLFGPEWWRTEAEKVIGDIVNFPGGMVPEGIDLRQCVIPREGNHFLNPDLEQIEPRVAAVIVKDNKFVEILKSGVSPYVAHAIATGMYDAAAPPLTKSNPIYALAKARELALSYNAGHHKFIVMAPLYVPAAEVDRIFSAPVSDVQQEAYENYLLRCNIPTWTSKWERADAMTKTWLVNSWLIVEDFRAKKPKTVAMWKKMHHALQWSIGEDLDIELPSGRVMRYSDIQMENNGSSKELYAEWFFAKLRGVPHFFHLSKSDCSLDPRDWTSLSGDGFTLRETKSAGAEPITIARRGGSIARTLYADGLPPDEIARKIGSGMEIEDRIGRKYKAKIANGELTALIPSFGRLQRCKLYGGALFNNLIQGTARDAYAECWLRVAAAGYEQNVVLSIHDELVLDVPKSVQPETIKELMGQAPEWMPTLPVTSSCESLAYYTK